VALERSRLVVGLSSSVLEPQSGGGRLDGIGTYTLELERALVAHDVDVRRVGAPHRAGSRLVPPRHASLTFPLPLSYLTAAAASFGANVPFARRVEREIDVYHATDYLVPRLASTPVVATLYDAIPLAHPSWANPRLRTVKNWLLRRCAQAADLVIAISQAAVAELVEHYGVAPESIRVVPLGVSDRWFDRPGDDFIRNTLAHRGLRPGFILHVGTLQPRKNLDALISAYETLPLPLRSDHQLVLVGKYGWGADELRARLERLGSEARVVWLDYVERDELHALYCAAGLFAYPSLSEGFGLPVLEALACGLPIVASDLPVLHEVADATARLVDPLRIDAIADAIETALAAKADPAHAAARRAHARKFTWASCAARTVAVYRELTM